MRYLFKTSPHLQQNSSTSCLLSEGGFLNGVALFAGIGGLDLGVNIIYPDSRTVCYVEGEMYCAQLLSKKMRKGELADAPIYSDVKTFSSVAHIFTDKVDFITAGFPCQPFSTAGDRKGTSDDRWLWYDIIEIISIIRPRFLFLENVANIVNDRDAFSTILETLSKIGFNVEWSTLRASDVGANHQRNRIFIFAYATDSDQKRFGGRHSLGERKQETSPKVERRVDDSTQREVGNATDSNSQRRKEPHASTFSTSSRLQYICSSSDEGNATNSDFLRPLQTNNRRSSSSCCSRSQQVERSIPSSSSWWQNQPDVLRVDDGVSFGMDRLRGLGNAVVPLQAATAFYHLIQRGFEE